MVNSIQRCAIGAMLAAVAAAPATGQQTVRLPAKDVVLKEAPTNVYSVGTVEGRDWEMFSGIRSVAFDRSDNMYLLDGQNLRVVVFDAQGKYVRQFGKKGGGPGEFQAPFALDIASDGNVVVSDLGNRAFIVFRPDGTHVRNVTFGDDVGLPVGGVVADRAGGVVSRSMPRITPDQQQSEASRYSTVFRQALTDGEPKVQSLYRVPVPPPTVIDAGSSGNARRVASINMDPVFSARPTFGVLPTGLAIHHETEYAIRILDNNGRHVRTLTRDFKPRKVTKKDQEEWESRRATEQASGGGPIMITATANAAGASGVSIGRGGSPPPGATMRFELDNIPFAEYMSVISSIRTDATGRIWAQRRQTNGTAAGPIDLISADGRYIGTLPAQPMPNAVSASGLAAWVQTDELGVERVTVRRLPASWR